MKLPGTKSEQTKIDSVAKLLSIGSYLKGKKVAISFINKDYDEFIFISKEENYVQVIPLNKNKGMPCLIPFSAIQKIHIPHLRLSEEELNELA